MILPQRWTSTRLAANAKREGHRTTLATPLLREDVLIGVILVRRREVRPYSDEEVALIETFADQAVIAIENARLFEAEKRRALALAHANETSRIANGRFGAWSSPTSSVFSSGISTVAFLRPITHFWDRRIRPQGPRSGSHQLEGTDPPRLARSRRAMDRRTQTNRGPAAD